MVLRRPSDWLFAPHLQVSNSSSFTADLGLDSLDAVEVVMAVEEEFSIEIPDAEADNITTVQQAIDYIAKTPEGKRGSLLAGLQGMLIPVPPSAAH